MSTKRKGITKPHAVMFWDWIKPILENSTDKKELCEVILYLLNYQFWAVYNLTEKPEMPQGQTAKIVLSFIQDRLEKMCDNYANKIFNSQVLGIKEEGGDIEGEEEKEEEDENENENENEEKKNERAKRVCYSINSKIRAEFPDFFFIL